MPTILKISIPGQEPLAIELEPGDSIGIEYPAVEEEEDAEEVEESTDEVEDGRAEGDEEEEVIDEGAAEKEVIEDEEDPDDEPRAANLAAWRRVAGFDAMPSHRREALASIGPMRRGASLIAHNRALPEGFTRKQSDSFVFLLSDITPGRDGFILAGPWELDEYRANPVVLYQHNDTWETPSAQPDDLLPVGRCIQVAEPREGLLISEVVFDTEAKRGANLDRLYRQGFLSAVSARWYPKSVAPAWKLDESDPYYSSDEDTWVMYGNNLLEQSAVVIPGLAGATLLEGPLDAERALNAARPHLSDPSFRSDMEAAILAAPATRAKPPAAEPTNDEPAPGWFSTLPQE